ncbi:MAG: carboxypeptidase-like regulatory domain-containing protein [Cyclonatronaceae bacterium]
MPHAPAISGRFRKADDNRERFFFENSARDAMRFQPSIRFQPSMHFQSGTRFQPLVATAFFVTALLVAACADDPDPDISGTVTRPDSTPVAGAEVMIAYQLEGREPRSSSTSAGVVDLSADLSADLFKDLSYADMAKSGSDHPDGAAVPDTNRIYPPVPNPSCDGFQSVRFELADSASVTLFARSLHGLTDYDHLFQEPYPPGEHQITYQMLPGLYEINVTFLPDTLVSFIVPELADLEWDRGQPLTECDGMEGFPTETIDITDDKGRFTVNREDLIWRPRFFPITAEDGARYRLGVHAALFVRPAADDDANDPAPVTHFREIDLSRSGHFVELTHPGQ